MPRAEVGTGNLRVLIYGQGGVGKTFTWLKMVKDNPESTFHVIDVDAGVNETIAGFPKKERDEMLKRINYYLCDSWQDVMDSFDDIKKTLKPNDWIVLEQLGQLWDLVQEHYTREVFGADLGEYYAQMRQEMIKRKKSGADGQARLDGWKDWCFPSLYSQIMTENGWKSYNEISIGDKVLTIDPNTKKSNFEPLIDIYISKTGERLLYRMEGRNHKSLSTNGHRWLVTGTPSRIRRIADRKHLHLDEIGKLHFCLTPDIKDYDRIPISALFNGFPTNPTYTDAFVEIMAWFWTEGDYIKKGVDGYSTGHIGQKDKENVIRIRKALEAEYGRPGAMGHKGRNGILWNDYTRKDGVTIFSISKNIVKILLDIAPNKVPKPEFIRALTKKQLHNFIDVSVLADGNTRLSQRVWNQSDKERVEIFEMACALAGIATNTTVNKWRSKWAKKEKWRVGMLKRCMVQPKFKEIVKYNGIVWCPSTPSGTWLAKNEGTVFYTGNSVIKKLHNQDFIETLTKRLICQGVILTSATKELDDNPMYESGEVIDIFKSIGFKPEGEKHNIFRVDAILFLTKDKKGKRWVKSPKSRGMNDWSEEIPEGQTGWDVYTKKRKERDVKSGGGGVSIPVKQIEKTIKNVEDVF